MINEAQEQHFVIRTDLQDLAATNKKYNNSGSDLVCFEYYYIFHISSVREMHCKTIGPLPFPSLVAHLNPVCLRLPSARLSRCTCPLSTWCSNTRCSSSPSPQSFESSWQRVPVVAMLSGQSVFEKSKTCAQRGDQEEHTNFM